MINSATSTGVYNSDWWYKPAVSPSPDKQAQLHVEGRKTKLIAVTWPWRVTEFVRPKPRVLNE